VTRDRYAGGLSSKGKLPASIQLEHSARTEQGDQRSDNATTDKAMFRIADRHNADWLTDLTFEHEDTQETATYTYPGIDSFTQNLPVKRDEMNVTNLYKFGPGPEKHSLAGRIRWLDRTGSYVDKILSAEQNLELRHSKTFTTFYSGSFLKETTDTLTQDNYSLSAGLTKKFYDSLVTGLQGNYRDIKYGDGGYDKYSRVAGSLDYTKKTQVGLFNSAFQISRENEDTAYSGGLFHVRNESVTLTDITPVQLQRTNIVPGSIRVTDANDVQEYFENIDYVLTTFGSFIRIARKEPTTSITSGQTVHVSYDVSVPRQSTIATDRMDWLNRLALNAVPVDVYTRYRSRKDTLTAGQDPNNLEDEKSILVGAEYHNSGLIVAIEHENNDRLLSPPSVVDLIRAGYSRQLSRELVLTLDAHYRKTRYKQAAKFDLQNGRDTLDDLGANVQLTARLDRSTLVRFMSEYSDYKGQENRSLFRNSVELEWRKGKLSFLLNAHHDTFTQEQSKGQATTVTFNLKREF